MTAPSLDGMIDLNGELIIHISLVIIPPPRVMRLFHGYDPKCPWAVFVVRSDKVTEYYLNGKWRTPTELESIPEAIDSLRFYYGVKRTFPVSLLQFL